MNPIDALKVSFQPAVNQTAKASKTKTEGTAAELGAFSQLLASATAETTETGSEPTTEIQAQLEEILKALQDLPEEELAPEQQEMLSALVQFLTLQVKQLDMRLEEQGLTQSKPATDLVQDEAFQSGSVLAKLPEETANQERTTVLLQQIQQKLEQLTTYDNIEFDIPSEFVGVETEKPSLDPEQLKMALKQLAETIQELENAESGKQITSAQSEKIEQVVKHMAQLTQNLEKQAPPAETVRAPVDSAEPVRIIQAMAAFQLQENNKGLKVEKIAEPVSAISTEAAIVELVKTSSVNEEAPTLPIEGTKAQAVQTAPRVETSAPIVRMTNLVEDLSGLLRGSMRLSGTGENAQIKVSIFPEHLGHLDIRLTTVDGKVAAQIFTSSLMAKEAIEMQLNQLRNTMLQQGVNLDRIEITQQSAEQSFGQQTANPEQRSDQQQKQGTPNNKNGYQRIEEEVAAATSRRQAPDGSMMKVDYTI